jgi:prolyl oligopeptidase
MSLLTPTSRTCDEVTDFHGTKVPDPYRWLEAQGDAEVEAWVDAQNSTTRKYLAGLPQREQVRTRLAELWTYARRGVPAHARGRQFETRNDGSQEQDALWVIEGDAERLLLTLPAETALAAFEPSPCGRLLAVGTTSAGSDWVTLRVLDVDSGGFLIDRIEWLKIPYVAWLPNGIGFVYSGFAPPEHDQVLLASNRGQQVRLHRLGESMDQVLYEPPAEVAFVVPHVDAGHLVVEVLRAATPTTVLVGPLGGELQPVADGEAVVRFVGIIGDEVLLQSHDRAPNGSVLAVGLTDGRARTLVPESSAPLDAARGSAFLFGGDLVTIRTQAMSSQVTVTDPATGTAYDLDLPAGLVAFARGHREEPVFAFFFLSPTEPAKVLEHDLRTRKTTTRFAPQLPGYDPGALVVEDFEVASTDGVRVPVRLIRHRDVAPDRARPTLVSGYGGFGIVFGTLGFHIGFRLGYVPWLEAGGVLVLTGLRGGGEYGEQWHLAGTRERKQNVFNDAIAVCEWLVEQGWTSPEHLALTGSSNGGLLAGAVLTQRPDLLAAVVPDVGVLDMLRYHQFTGGRAWTAEYGCAKDPDDFTFLRAYSPVHNVTPVRSFPATLITTGDHDDRVPPGVHSYKFAATLQAAQGGGRPVLLRVQRDAGHGAGRATSTEIDERADVLAFLLENTK